MAFFSFTFATKTICPTKCRQQKILILLLFFLESVESHTEVDLSDDQEDKMIAASKNQRDSDVKPVRPIPVLPATFPYPSPSLEKSSKNIILPQHPFVSNPFMVAAAPMQNRMAKLDSINVKNLDAFHQAIQAQKLWSEQSQLAKSQLYEAMYHQLLANPESLESQGRRLFNEKVQKTAFYCSFFLLNFSSSMPLAFRLQQSLTLSICN